MVKGSSEQPIISLSMAVMDGDGDSGAEDSACTPLHLHYTRTPPQTLLFPTRALFPSVSPSPCSAALSVKLIVLIGAGFDEEQC